MTYTLHLGDCLETLKTLADNSVDSIVTDPPYGLSDHKPAEVTACLSAWVAGQVYAPKGSGFMGKKWDAWVPGPEIWRECLRVLKPGGHLLAFAGTRSMDLMSMSVRLSGFELRDAIGYANDGGGAPLMAWTFGSGFPKSADMSKAIDKAAGVEREDKFEGAFERRAGPTGNKKCDVCGKWLVSGSPCQCPRPQDDAVTEAARQWQGWGTALKPAWEPIILARKPLTGTVAANVLEHGTGALNIDGCRVGATTRTNASRPRADRNGFVDGFVGGTESIVHDHGRWPANLIHDGSDEVVKLFPQTSSGKMKAGTPYPGGIVYGSPSGVTKQDTYGDNGSAARFFYCAKASKKDRDEGLEGFEAKPCGLMEDDNYDIKTGSGNSRNTHRANIHPTVKPTDLMRYLCRLVTPLGGVVLDPFMGSGSTGKAAMLEGFDFIGCELSPEYMEIAKARIEATQKTPIQPEEYQKDLFAQEA